MAERANRNILAALLIVAGAILVAVSPVSADGEQPKIVHNIGWGPRVEDMLFDLKIHGHFRWRQAN